MAATQLDRLLFIQGQRCHFCHKHREKAVASVEHLVPLSRRGADEEHNTVACCKTLNGIFGSMELKAKLETILRYSGKFVCPAEVATAKRDVTSVADPRRSLVKQHNAALVTERGLEHLRHPGNRTQTKKTLARYLSAQLQRCSTRAWSR